MIAANGEAKTEAWIKGLVDNFARPPAGGDRDQLKAVAAGQCDVALANTYYLGQMLKSSDPAEAEAAKQIGVFWPNQQDRGVHVNISGAGVTKSAKNKENAVKLLEYMVNDAAQQWYAQENLEYPLKPGIAVAEILKAWGEFKSDTLNLAKLGELNAQAVMLMDKAGWK
jgi:iron(III) transport system substrate-binding protein